MDVDARDGEGDRGGGEGLVLQFADLRAVERVGAARGERVEVEEGRALADLLVGGEADPQRRPGQLGVGGEVRDRRHDLGDARFVVGAEEGVAAARDEVVAHFASEGRHRGRIEHGAAAWQLDDAAVVGAVHDRLDAVGGGVGAHVDVSDQPITMSRAASTVAGSVAIT